MTAMTWIVVNYLGLSSNIIPLNINTRQAKKDGELLLKDIISGGNFGKGYGFMNGFKRNNHLNNIPTYIFAFWRMLKIRRLCPTEVDAYIKYWIREQFLKW